MQHTYQPAKTVVRDILAQKAGILANYANTRNANDHAYAPFELPLRVLKVLEHPLRASWNSDVITKCRLISCTNFDLCSWINLTGQSWFFSSKPCSLSMALVQAYINVNRHAILIGERERANLVVQLARFFYIYIYVSDDAFWPHV